MALLANGVRLSALNPMRQYGGGSIGSLNRVAWGVGPAQNNQWAGEASLSNKNGLPAGYRHPYCWLLPLKDGGLASRSRAVGSGTVSAANLAGGLNAAAALTGTGTITNAALALVVSGVASLSGSGAVAGAIVGVLRGAATLSGAGSISASLGALASLLAALSGSGGATGTATAKGSMSAEIVVTGEALSTANVAAAVWNALIAQHLSPGSTGEALNAAGAAGDPWITSIPGSYTAGQAGYVVGNLLASIPAELLDEPSAVDGYTVRQILRLLAAACGGKSSGGASDDTLRDLADSKNRIVTTVDANGHRTAVTLDLT